MKDVPIASYWCNLSGFGSSLFSGSSYVESSGIYGQLREVNGRSGVGSCSVSDGGSVGGDGVKVPPPELGEHVSVRTVSGIR